LAHRDEGDPITGLTSICTRHRGHRGDHIAYDVGGLDVLDTWPASAPDSLRSVLDSLAMAHRDLSRVVTRRDRLVSEARSLGATWSQIGSTLGISAQGAQKRYGTGSERQEAHQSRQAARKASKAAQQPDTPSEGDPWPDGTVQGKI
jgi:hypothetical protein